MLEADLTHFRLLVGTCSVKQGVSAHSRQMNSLKMQCEVTVETTLGNRPNTIYKRGSVDLPLQGISDTQVKCAVGKGRFNGRAH